MFIKNATDVKSVIDISLKDSDPSIVLHTFRNKLHKYLSVLTGNIRMVDIGINASSTLFRNLQIKYCLFSS